MRFFNYQITQLPNQETLYFLVTLRDAINEAPEESQPLMMIWCVPTVIGKVVSAVAVDDWNFITPSR